MARQIKVPDRLLQLAHGDYQVTEARFVEAEVLADLARIYGGRAAPARLEELQNAEAALDLEWPGWRRKQPLGGLPPDILVAIKTLLLHRVLVLVGRADWTTLTVWHRGAPLIIPVRPEQQQSAIEDGHPLPEPHRARLSVPVLACKLGVPIERVEKILQGWDPKAEPNVRRFIEAALAAVKPVKAPKAEAPK